jgi:hypothetical protein
VGEHGRHFTDSGELAEFRLALFGVLGANGAARGQEHEGGDDEGGGGDEEEVMAGVFDEEVGSAFGDVDAGEAETRGRVKRDVGAEERFAISGKGLGSVQLASFPQGSEVGRGGVRGEDGDVGEGAFFIEEKLTPVIFAEGGGEGFEPRRDGGDAAAKVDGALSVEGAVGAEGTQD